MGLFSNTCEYCNTKVKNRFSYAVLSKNSDTLYFPKTSSALKWEAGKVMADAEGWENTLNAESSSFNYIKLCFKCAEEIQREQELKTSNLITCPDCNGSVSKRASTCPHCGCPIGELVASNPDTIKPTIDEKNLPKCPTCQSSNIEGISLANKAGSVALVGIFALGRVSKTFQCNNCGYKW